MAHAHISFPHSYDSKLTENAAAEIQQIMLKLALLYFKLSNEEVKGDNTARFNIANLFKGLNIEIASYINDRKHKPCFGYLRILSQINIKKLSAHIDRAVANKSFIKFKTDTNPCFNKSNAMNDSFDNLPSKPKMIIVLKTLAILRVIFYKYSSKLYHPRVWVNELQLFRMIASDCDTSINDIQLTIDYLCKNNVIKFVADPRSTKNEIYPLIFVGISPPTLFDDKLIPDSLKKLHSDIVDECGLLDVESYLNRFGAKKMVIKIDPFKQIVKFYNNSTLIDNGDDNNDASNTNNKNNNDKTMNDKTDDELNAKFSFAHCMINCMEDDLIISFNGSIHKINVSELIQEDFDKIWVKRKCKSIKVKFLNSRSYENAKFILGL